MSPKNHLHRSESSFDVCVVGGGMAGICAAIASARNGAKTAIIHDRPVFGGNASSEIRMWICGAHGDHNKETGILEEIQLENQYRNPMGNYSVWDSVLYGKIFFQPNLTTFLNASVTDAEMSGGRIASVQAWQLTTQTWHTIRAKTFIDCSGDSILAAVTGAEFRVGREARAEFNEDIEPHQADRKTMGNSLLIQLRRTDEKVPYIPPSWAYRFEKPEDLPNRMRGVHAHNFWWIEVGGLQDTIRDGEVIRDELMKITYGVWDYIKNRAPEREEAETWAVEWIGSLPGKRENRRYVGDHTLTQNDVRAGGKFEDTIAYGGWSMDDHHPAGIFYPGAPTIFHPAPSPYGIPYRSLYSKNIPNLMFAGRNISVTHAALSSTRVMATCALLGQAAGTAAALANRHRVDPRALSSGEKLQELKQTLMDDDCWLPGFTRKISDLASRAKLDAKGENPAALRDGMDRDRPDEKHSFQGQLGKPIEFSWSSSSKVAGARIVFDSNLALPKMMPCSYPHRESGAAIPKSLVKSFRLEAKTGGEWKTVFRETENHRRLVTVPVRAEVTGLRLIPEETWGAAEARLFSFEALEVYEDKLPTDPKGPAFVDVRSKLSPKDLAAPESVVAPEGKKAAISA